MTLSPTFDVWLPGDNLTGLLVHDLDVDLGGLRLTVAAGPDADPADFGLTVDGGVASLTVRTTANGRTRITAVVPTKDAVTLWRPGSARDFARIPAAWEPPETITSLRGMALGCLLGPDDASIATFGAEAGTFPIEVRAGLIEETAELLITFEVTGAPADTLLRAHIDLGGRTFTSSVPGMAERLSGPRKQPAPVDEMPVLCTWYFMHQAVDGDALGEYAEPAAHLGFGTLIVDDGWQTDDVDRGYGSAGDWSIAPAKIADATHMVSHFASHGLRTMWWIGTPFVGHRSSAVSALPVVDDDPRMHAAILDTRSASARQHLVDRIAELVQRTGSHGVKIDFLERFSGSRTPTGVEDGALSLLDDLRARLDEVVDHPSIEFREPYFGPEGTRRATMMRVNDCPMSPTLNRIGVADLRLATRGVAIHTDPIMWAEHDSPARVAQHLINGLFGVLQISVDILVLPAAQRRVLQFWLRIAADHRDLLLHGTFRPVRPDLGYPIMEAADGVTVFTGRFGPTKVTVPRESWTTWLIANADDVRVPLDDVNTVADDVRWTVHSPDGIVVSTGLGALPATVEVPTGGLLRVERC